MLDTVILAAVGLLVTAAGVAVSRGRTDLLTQYPENDGPRELAVRAGGTLALYGLVTVAFGVLLIWRDEPTLLWAGWMVVTVAVAFGVAGLAVTSD